MKEEKVVYRLGKTEMQGHLVYDNSSEERRPAVLVAHAWMGQDDFARQKARDLARMGYVGFAIDLYGNGIEVTTPDLAEKLMIPLFLNRQLLRDHIKAGYEALRQRDLVDQERIGAIGFCFGGLAVLELLRSGAKTRGVVTFHGALAHAKGELKATTTPIAKEVIGSCLILHGHEDPLVSAADIKHVQDELTAAKVDWEMDIYGHTVHAFTNPAVSDYKNGLAFSNKAAHRSWQRMRNFFEEVFI